MHRLLPEVFCVEEKRENVRAFRDELPLEELKVSAMAEKRAREPTVFVVLTLLCFCPTAPSVSPLNEPFKRDRSSDGTSSVKFTSPVYAMGIFNRGAPTSLKAGFVQNFASLVNVSNARRLNSSTDESTRSL